MKRNAFKLFLVLGVIILSLFAFASCKETPPENPPEGNNNEEQTDFTIGNLEIIEDEELIEFIIKSHPSYTKNSIVALSQKLTTPVPDILLIDMYRAVNYDSKLKIKEYSVLNEKRNVACYAPKYVLENLFQVDMESFITENCNTYLFQDVKDYIRSNKLSYRDLKLIFCYADKNDLQIINQDYVLIYIADILSAESIDGDVTICAPLHFYVNEESLLIIETDNSNHIGRKVLRISEGEEKFLSISDVRSQSSCEVEKLDGIEVVKVPVPTNFIYQEQNHDFFDLILPAFLSSEELFNSYGNLYGYSYAYNYEIIKEILKIY